MEDLKAINRGVIKNFRTSEVVEGFDRDGLILLTTVGASCGFGPRCPVRGTFGARRSRCSISLDHCLMPSDASRTWRLSEQRASAGGRWDA